MERSFELLSSMSPKIRGRQQTVKINKASKLALKKHFRRSIKFDKPPLVRNENLAVVEVNTETSESIASSTEGKNDIVIIDSTDSEEDDSPKEIVKEIPSGNNHKNTRIRQWLNNVEEGKQNETFFSQVSTICGDNAPVIDKDGDHIAACSSFFDYLTHRFDELFVNKKNDLEMKIKEDEKVDDLSDDSFSLGISVSLTSKLKKTNTSSDTSGSSNEKRANKNGIIDETLFTSDESIVKTPRQNPLPKDEGFVSIRKKRENVNTPSGQSVQDVESMLDSLYGKKWREKQQRVLLPMSEPKKKINDKKVGAPNTERTTKPKIKENLLTNVQPAEKKLNFAKLKKPIESPWMHRLKGLVDSDSDSNTENSGRDAIAKAKGIEMVKTKLDFSEDSPVESKVKTKENVKKKVAPSNKENCPNNANRKVSKKPNNNVKPPSNKNTKKNTKTGSLSTSSSNSCSEEDVSTDEEYEKEIEMMEIKRKSMMPTKNKTYNFLESLSDSVPINKCDISARIFRTCFKQYKEELAKKLFSLFNERVFTNAIPSDTELEWNDKLRKTAGLCHCKRITHKDGKVERKVKVTLSTKVLDSADRLRDTLIHEMCHAATWMVNQISDGHGPYWKRWAFKAMETFPELPPISRCHSYAVNSKYTYRCTNCGYSFGRHSKSLDTERKRCGLCYGKFEVLLNRTTKSGQTKTVPVTPRKEATGFALFVKENYARHKDPSRKHGDVMKVLGQKFAELKVKNAS